MGDIRVRYADWIADQAAICAIRWQVFVDEQHIPEDLEWDGLDSAAWHLLGGPAGEPPCATARLLRTGQIGRMAVLPPRRGMGLGSALLAELVRSAAEIGIQRVFLHAQERAIGFYRRHGFEIVGDPFEEAGIIHHVMIREYPGKRS